MKCRPAANWPSRSASRAKPIEGDATHEPAFGIPALWIRNDAVRKRRAQAGYTVVDPVTVMGTHISEFVRRYAHELFSRQDAKKAFWTGWR